MTYEVHYPTEDEFNPRTEEERLGEERMESIGGSSRQQSKGDLVGEIGRRLVRNRIAIEHASEVLKDSAHRTEQLDARMRESDKRADEALKVLRKAGLLKD